jgi:hypothetical protein
MFKSIKVLMIIAIAGTMLQFAYNVTEFVNDGDSYGYSDYGNDYEELWRILIYWLVGGVSLVIGCRLWDKVRIIALAVGSGGVYLMVLGANGGLWMEMFLWLRMIFVVVNLILFLLVLYRFDKMNKKDLPEMIEGQEEVAKGVSEIRE